MNTASQDAPTPAVLGGVVSYLQVSNASAASEFYQTAFGAREVARHPVDDQGRTMHIHLYLNGGSLMLSDPFPEHGHPLEKPQGFSLLVRADDVETLWNSAVAAGAQIVMPMQEMFWGDRYGQLRDPFGVLWGLGQPIGK